MNLVYQVKDRPPIWTILVCAFQQLLAILTATILVPVIVGNGMSQAAALFGAGAGTLVYCLFTKFKSPVFLGSSFAFLGSMSIAFAGAVSMAAGYTGLLFGAFCAACVYCILSIIVHFCGTTWIDKIMPAVVIGPTVTIIGLSLATNAVSHLTGQGYRGLIAGIVALLTTVLCSAKGKKTIKLIPFIIGIASGYIVALILGLVDFTAFESMQWVPTFNFIQMNIKDALTSNYLLTIAIAYIPVAFVVFAEHIADHKNLSNIIGQDLLKDPGLSRTLLGDGVGSLIGAFFGGCPNTTYGESVACIAISGNASVYVTVTTAIMAIIASFIAPFTTLLTTIPTCVMGGVEIILYGFIASSGLTLFKDIDLSDNANLFTVATILVAGVGGLVITIGSITITNIACALLLGIIINFICHLTFKKN